MTRQYNAEMKKKLPLYGIEVSELSRKSIFISDTEECIISASLVRKLYQEENWDALRKLVPETTFQFLKTKPEMRDKKTIAELKGDACDVHEWTALFAKNEKVVLYATGDDGSKVYERLTDVQKKKVFFSDIKAIQKDYIFYGKNVLSPCMLIADLLEAPILITTKKYWADAWSYLIKLGIDSKRLHLNNALY